MKLGNIFAAAAALTLASAPALAAPANPAASLSVAKAVRASSPQGKDKLAGSGLIVAGIAAVAVIVGVIIIADDDDNSDSN